eukprot:Gb_31793 [translate_table: standard]
MEWCLKWREESNDFQRAGLQFTFFTCNFEWQGRWRVVFSFLAIVWCVVHYVGLCASRSWKRVCRNLTMGGDHVTIEPTILKIDKEVRSILEEAGLLPFFKKFSGHSDSITNQIVESWKDGRVSVNGLEILINEVLLVDVSALPCEGEVISRDKTSQVGQLTKFIRDDEMFCWLDSGIARESLSKPWDRVAVQVMKYLTLEGKFWKLFGYHIAILNSMRNKEKVNIPLFLLKSMEKSVKAVKAGKGKSPLHQGLMKMLVDFKMNRKSIAAGPSKGGFVRISGTPVSKAQLLLGSAPSSPLLVSGDSASNSEEVSRSQDGDFLAANPKDGGGKKRNPLAQILSANLVKCSRRSSRLQRKSAEKAKSMDDAGPSGEERKFVGPGPLGERSSSLKVPVAAPLEKGPAKSPDGSHSLAKKLRCHLRVLNGLVTVSLKVIILNKETFSLDVEMT